MSITDSLNRHLEDLRGALPEIRGAVIASSDGLSIAHSITGGDPNRMAAMVATALGLGKRISDTFGGGALNETSVSGVGAQVFVYAAGSKGVLAVIAPPQANVGLIHLECRDCARKIQEILG